MTEPFLLARIAGHQVALPTAAVESVVDIGEVVPVPGADARVRGLAALRSRVVTVVDTGAVLGLGALAGTRAAIVAVDGHHYALLVDALEDVARFQRTAVTPGVALAPAWAAAVVGMVERDGEPLLVLDPAALAPTPAAAA